MNLTIFFHTFPKKIIGFTNCEKFIAKKEDQTILCLKLDTSQ